MRKTSFHSKSSFFTYAINGKTLFLVDRIYIINISIPSATATAAASTTTATATTAAATATALDITDEGISNDETSDGPYRSTNRDFGCGTAAVACRRRSSIVLAAPAVVHNVVPWFGLLLAIAAVEDNYNNHTHHEEDSREMEHGRAPVVSGDRHNYSPNHVLLVWTDCCTKNKYICMYV